MHSKCRSLILLYLFAGTSVATAESLIDRTPELTSCLACHGQKAEGNQILNAPALTNLGATYLRRQLRNFRDGIRGADQTDATGYQMRIAVQDLNDEKIENMTSILTALPNSKPEATLAGDAQQGKAFYGHLCGACHGPAGVGIESLGAPGLAGLDDWYMKTQLEKFKSGLRGGSQEDSYGAQMVFVMQRLNSDEGIADIIAYLRDVDEQSQ
ncbi:MAG TPA: c-type cytochrome [Pseudomonadales bacterium]|jgi:cytochrome c oxidase subunit 2|nr:cytochrome C [Gammaproteobacteria bacterium]MDP6025250.1 c-type cytochrome [Pseudomonadales bacterium]MDP6315307.1 c-type cytochrome [Pseudomonadales bacterium]MDP7314755.1 c-type cytochrome [Pseudomonadales bacterium]MDP7576627.1 c-type cytochrome [Pseudomonadales bacterium]